MPSSRPEGTPALVVEWDVQESLEETLDRGFLERVLTEALSGRRVGSPLAVGVAVVDDEAMRQLNLRYRGVDAPTDILSFPLLEYEAPEEPENSFPQPPGEPVELGDIVISYERAAEQAESYGHSFERELGFLAVHGVMHLLGYDHEKPAHAERMRREEESVLERLGLGR